MNRDNNGRFTKVSKELSIGDKITSFDQLKEGMIIDFEANAHVDIGFNWIKVNNAILVRDMDSYGNWYACHDNGRAHGDRPFNNLTNNLTIKDRLIKMFNKKYSWRMILSDINEDGEFTDSRNIIFKGYHSSLKDDKKVEEVKPKYKINDIVLVRESLINDNRCCCKITNYIKDHGYTLSVLTTPHPLHIYNFKEENIIKKIGIFVED